MHWNHRLIRDEDGLHLAEVYYYDDGEEMCCPEDMPGAFGYVPVGLSWRTWLDFLRHPTWLWRVLRRPMLHWPKDKGTRG